jgi:hypothetical protein
VVEQRPAGLNAYERLPHCGAVVTGAEPDRIRRLVTWLDGEVQRRAATRFAPSGDPDPWIVLIIDGWEYFEDRGYLGVDLKHRLLVSPRLRAEFGNGEQFYAKAGEQIALPAGRVDRPHKEFLEWHLDTMFKAA